ncbi:transposable element Tc1 transposase [Trichonephila clavipes]|nr:transposable element Tc1 transposase [Trichonephila clavipes]
MKVPVVQSVNGVFSACFIVCVSGAIDLRENPCSLLLHRVLRLSWAREHIYCSVDDWEQVAWSNGPPFQLHNADGKLRMRRQAHKPVDPVCQIGTVKGHGGSNMVQDVFSWHCLGSLVRVPTSLNAI